MDSGPATSWRSGMTTTSLLRFLFFFLIALLALAAQRCAEDVAQGGAGIRRAVLGDRLFLLGDFQRLDGDGGLLAAAVELYDARIDLLANGKAVGALLGPVAGKLRTLDERGEFGADDLDVDATFLDLGDLAGDHRALFQFATSLL